MPEKVGRSSCQQKNMEHTSLYGYLRGCRKGYLLANFPAIMDLYGVVVMSNLARA